MFCFSRDAWILKEENRAGMGLENRDFFLEQDLLKPQLIWLLSSPSMPRQSDH